MVKKSAAPAEKELLTPIHDSFTAAILQKASNVARPRVKLAENQIGGNLGRVCQQSKHLGENSKK